LLRTLIHSSSESFGPLTTIYQFYTQWGVAWSQATKGEWIRAMRLLDKTLAAAPDPMREGFIHVDRARISRAALENMAAESSCAAALHCLESIDWSKAKNDEAIGVMGTMDILSRFPERARLVFEQAAHVKISKMIGGAHGRRFEAFQHFALSYLAQGTEAFEHAQAAYAIFKGFKYIHRAADCAIRAVELGGGARWRSRVERLVAPYLRSLAARQYELANAPMNRIRGRRREVLLLLVTTNDTAKMIGERLGMEEATVRVHTRDIYRALGVDSRTQLVRAYLARIRPIAVRT
jgi:DNA-binding NarL/FixJ family response regulator